MKTVHLKQKAPQKSLAEQAYETLSGMILARELSSGTFIVEERLAEELSISRTPMREAILRLAAQGLLVRAGTRSYAVRTVTAAEFFQSHKVREWLEPEAIELSAGKIPNDVIDDLCDKIRVLANTDVQERAHWQIDDRLHNMFAESSGNMVLAKIAADIRVTTRLFEITNPARRVRKDGEEHLAILEAFRAGDIKGARRAMVKHIRNLVADTAAILQGL